MRSSRSSLINSLTLDPNYSLLSAKHVALLLEFFKAMDFRGEMALDDVQFYVFMKHATDLTKNQIYQIFDMLDVDHSGHLDFDEFYLLICILVSIKDMQEKEFIYHHSRTVFELLDQDGSGNISADEFQTLCFIFNFDAKAVKQIFNEFDISGDQELDYQEFKMFAMACIDRQKELTRQSQTLNRKWWSKILDWFS